MTTTLEESALTAAVIADPADDVVRLVMADWLDESGQPERAELIRVGVKLAGLTEPKACEVKTIGYIGETPPYLMGCTECHRLKTSHCPYHVLESRQKQLLKDHGCGLLLSSWLKRSNGEKPQSVSIGDENYGDELTINADELIAGVDRGFFGKWEGEGWIEWHKKLRKVFPIVDVTIINTINVGSTSLNNAEVNNLIEWYQQRWPGIIFHYKPQYQEWATTPTDSSPTQ